MGLPWVPCAGHCPPHLLCVVDSGPGDVPAAAVALHQVQVVDILGDAAGPVQAPCSTGGVQVRGDPQMPSEGRGPPAQPSTAWRPWRLHPATGSGLVLLWGHQELQGGGVWGPLTHYWQDQGRRSCPVCLCSGLLSPLPSPPCLPPPLSSSCSSLLLFPSPSQPPAATLPRSPFQGAEGQAWATPPTPRVSGGWGDPENKPPP